MIMCIIECVLSFKMSVKCARAHKIQKDLNIGDMSIIMLFLNVQVGGKKWV